MNGWNNWGIKQKLSAIMIFLLALQMIVLLFAGSWMFERFYTASKVAEMKERAKSIREAYAMGSDTLYDQINSAEYENVVVTLYSFDGENAPKIIYHSRMNHDNEWKNRPGMPPDPREGEPNLQIPENFAERLKNAGESLDIQIENPASPPNNMGERRKWEKNWEIPGGVITLLTKLDDNLYLNIFTPRDYIKSIADLAVKYTAQLSMIILLAGSILIYFMMGRLTRPLRRVQEVADQIARLDFTQKCEVHGKDEISLLGQSINGMSQELEAAIGQLVAANEILKSDLERQQQTECIRRQFIADVSHDFKTPLTLMVSYAEALSESRQGQDKEYCDVIISEGNRLSVMVGKLLELSRLENGADPVEWSIFCLSEIVDEAVSHHRLLTEKKSLTVIRESEEPFIIHADFQKIMRVVINLFENAVKYSPEGGKITIRAVRQDPTLCRLEIENTGKQIAPEDLPRVFDSFYRADKSRGDGRSYGIGLATVKAIMETHGRNYGAENRENSVCFWVELETADFGEEDDDT